MVDIAPLIVIVLILNHLACLVVVAEVTALSIYLPLRRLHPLARKVGLRVRNRVEVGATTQVEAFLMLVEHADHLRVIMTWQLRLGELLVSSGAAICQKVLLRRLAVYLGNPSLFDKRTLLF